MLKQKKVKKNMATNPKLHHYFTSEELFKPYFFRRLSTRRNKTHL